MTTSTSSTSSAREDQDRMVAARPDVSASFGDPPPGYEDFYAVNELVTRHERTERAIRQAREQF